MTDSLWVFLVAAVAYATNAAFGSSVGLGWISSQRFRWVHHGLYVLTVLTTLAAVSSLLWSSSTAGWYLLPAVVPLALLPYVGSARRHRGRHVGVALAPLPFYVVSLTVSFSTGAGN
ncbi:hypothetical protein GC088_09550 [Arthrobacter sp. JZ12]|uniref:hypothetical protein n=1 Tax=Arthrobacter sp. JZ12 TaxID=2654190 RepID=UPI002B4A9699|nr:hypothetical protein [Arthrobacter sp. JZ12]WRH25279.1 hypothetical protein GC088_09550 [Arthrobacter sp. JZ12]